MDTGLHDLCLKHVEPGEFASAIPKVRPGSTVIAADVQEAHVTTLATSSVYSASNRYCASAQSSMHSTAAATGNNATSRSSTARKRATNQTNYQQADSLCISTFAVISSQQNGGDHPNHTDYGFRIASTQAEARISTTAAAASSTIPVSTSRCVHARMD